MSRPGDPDREQVLMEGSSADIVTQVVAVLHQRVPGVRSFQLAYDARDRELAEGEEPRPDEAVRWTASTVVRRRWPGTRRPCDRTFTGEVIVESGGNHGLGGVEACAALLEQLGANVVLVS